MGKNERGKSQINKESLVSIIIPSYNEGEVIGQLLSSIKNQSYRRIEIIVVDDGSTDNTREISKKFTPLVFARAHRERSVQRNFGAKKSKGKYLFFLDSDMELSKNVISECVKKIENDLKIAAIAVPEKSIVSNFWENVKAFERSFYNEEGDEVTDAARFFRKDTFEKVNGYDESITGPEDWDLPESIKKIGYKIGRINSKIYHYERVQSPFLLARKKYYYAKNVHRYLSKHNISAFGPKTIYFLRPIFYKKWKKLFSNPILGIAMFFMFTLELIGGGLGYLVGKLNQK